MSDRGIYNCVLWCSAQLNSVGAKPNSDLCAHLEEPDCNLVGRKSLEQFFLKFTNTSICSVYFLLVSAYSHFFLSF